MAEDQGKQEEEKFDFTHEGEAFGYISLDQARVLAMRTARETPGAYGRRFRNVPMAFEVVEAEETEDHYVVTLSFRPEGAFTGTPGREQLFIEKEGGLAVRQVLSLPGRIGWRRIPVGLVAIGLVVVVAGAVGGVFAATSGNGGSDDSASEFEAGPSPDGTFAANPPNNTVTPTPTPSPTSAAVLAFTQSPPSLVAWWPGDGHANDMVADHHGILMNGATFASGKVGQAFSFPRDGAHVEILYSNDDFNFAPTQPMTVVMWAKRTSPPGPLLSGQGMHLLGKRLRCDNSPAHYQLHYDFDDWGFDGPGWAGTGFSEGTAKVDLLPFDQWRHLAVTFDGTVFKFYIDGVLKAGPRSGTFQFPNNAPLLIGGSSGCSTFVGLIDEIAVFNYALTGGEVKLVYDGGIKQLPIAAALAIPTPTPKALDGNRVVYYDARYPATFAERYTGAIVPGLLSRGYQVADADELQTYMEARDEESCVVFAQDVVPDTVVDDPTAPTSNSLIREYMERGGRVVWIMDVPFFYVGFSDGSFEVIGNAGHRVLSTARFSNDDDHSDEVRITAAGARWGLTQPWRSKRPSAGDTTKLATVDGSSASAAYHLNFGGLPLSGFVRIWDTDNDLGPLTPEHLGDLDRMCEFPGGLVHHWTADGDAQDIFGGNHGTLQVGATFADGVVGQAFILFGADDRVELLGQPIISTAFTFSAWVNLDAGNFGSYQIIFNNNQFFLRKDSFRARNKLSIFVKLSDGTVEPRASSTTIPKPGTWYHVAGTWDGTTLRLYVNGTLEGSSRRQGVLTSTTVQAQIGRGEQSNLRANTLSGRIDEIRIYNRPLTRDEIEAIYDAGAAGLVK